MTVTLEATNGIDGYKYANDVKVMLSGNSINLFNRVDGMSDMTKRSRVALTAISDILKNFIISPKSALTKLASFS